MVTTVKLSQILSNGKQSHGDDGKTVTKYSVTINKVMVTTVKLSQTLSNG